MSSTRYRADHLIELGLETDRSEEVGRYRVAKCRSRPDRGADHSTVVPSRAAKARTRAKKGSEYRVDSEAFLTFAT